jgi:hypothetical protein
MNQWVVKGGVKSSCPRLPQPPFHLSLDRFAVDRLRALALAVDQ